VPGTANIADQFFCWYPRGWDGGLLAHPHSPWGYNEPEILRHSNRQFSHIGADAGQARTATTRSPRPSTSFTRPRSIHRRGSWRSFEAAEFAILLRVDRFNSSRMARANRLYPARSSRRTHLCSTIATNSSKKGEIANYRGLLFSRYVPFKAPAVNFFAA
jgi:hypothetical protein